jgi:hypothetical protein
VPQHINTIDEWPHAVKFLCVHSHYFHMEIIFDLDGGVRGGHSCALKA